MQSKRDYLVGLGLAKPGRGKFSNAAKEALSKAEAGGMKFSDATAAKTTGNPAKPVADRKTEATETPYLYPSDFRFPEGEWRATVNGKEVSLRECCNTCKVSLVNHACNTPTIHNNLPVKIVRR